MAILSFNLLIAEPANAQSIPKPSVPEFTLKLVDHSYDVPTTTTTTTDPYTGKQTVTTKPGYHVQNMTIEVTIKNQQFTPYSNGDQTIYVFYNVSYKGHYQDEWKYYPSGSYGRDSTATTRIYQSNSAYTVVPFGAPSEGQMDFRVQAQVGYYTSYQEFIMVPGAPFTTYIFQGEVSGWSNVQAISVPSDSTSASASPNPTASTSPLCTETPAQSNADSVFPQLSWLEIAAFAALGGVVAVLLVFLVLLRKRIRVLEMKQNDT